MGNLFDVRNLPFFNILINKVTINLGFDQGKQTRQPPVWHMKKLVLTVLFSLSLLGLYAQNYQLHSVFIYSFTRYVQWPEDANSGDFRIMVLGESPIISELNNMASKKKVGERSIHVTKIGSVSEVRKCNILFVSSDKSALFSEVLAKLEGTSTLVITEQPGLGAKGSNINFIQKDGKLAFELNASSFSKRGLKPSTELTRLAILI